MVALFVLCVGLLGLVRGDTDSLLLDVPGSSKRCLGENFAEAALGKWAFQVQGDGSKKESSVRVTLKDPNKKLLYSAVGVLTSS